MKKSKILKIALFVVVLIIAVFLLLNSCHCKPYKEEWHFFSYKADMVFLNGVTLNLGFSDASHAYPFAGIEHQNIGISSHGIAISQIMQHLGYPCSNVPNGAILHISHHLSNWQYHELIN